MAIKFVAFDIDGVIFSSEAFLQQSYYNGVLNYIKENPSKKFIPPEKDRILNQVGKTYREILTALFPGIKENEMKELRKYILKDLTLNINSKKGKLLKGVKPILLFLKDEAIKIGTASNGAKDYVESVLKSYNIYNYFDEIKYVDTEEFKEKTDILKYYKKKYNLKKEEMLMVGDRKTDLIAAFKADVLFVGIKGHGNENELKSSNFLINNLLELKEIINLFK